MLKTVTLCIGNSDDKLTQKQWSEFAAAIEKVLKQMYAEPHFSGFSLPNASWQNACWVFAIHDHKIQDLKNRIGHIRAEFQQDSAAIVVGDTEFV